MTHTFIWKDYQIIQDKLCKFNIDEKKHLLHQFGSVPCIDKKVWEQYKNKVQEIYIRTSKGKRFKINAKVFEHARQEIDLGFGKQYIVHKELWDISDKKEEKKEDEPTQLLLSNREDDTGGKDLKEVEDYLFN